MNNQSTEQPPVDLEGLKRGLLGYELLIQQLQQQHKRYLLTHEETRDLLPILTTARQRVVELERNLKTSDTARERLHREIKKLEFKLHGDEQTAAITAKDGEIKTLRAVLNHSENALLNAYNEGYATAQGSHGDAKLERMELDHWKTSRDAALTQPPQGEEVQPVGYATFRSRIKQLAKDLREAGYEYPSDCVAVADFDCPDAAPSTSEAEGGQHD
jgi:chromosome segregation ATPase